MKDWHGHHPDTSIALFSVLDGASANGGGLSADERILVITAEFWAAARSRALAAHLGANPGPKLDEAGAAWNALGAVRVAADVLDCADEVRGTSSGPQQEERIRGLEQRLAAAQEPVDALIALRARRCTAAMGSERRATVAAILNHVRLPSVAPAPPSLR